MKTGAQLILAERKRQVSKEGWDTYHDDEHNCNELAKAAICYTKAGIEAYQEPYRKTAISGWPWEQEWWKPSKDPIRNLVKAGALIAAEIDRLQREQKGQDEAK